MKVWTFVATILLTASTAFGAVPGDVLGLWKTAGGDSQLELFPCGDKICGKIVWLKVPSYIDSRDGPLGKTKGISRQSRGHYDCWPLEGAYSQSITSKSKPETATSRHTPGNVELWEPPTRGGGLPLGYYTATLE